VYGLTDAVPAEAVDAAMQAAAETRSRAALLFM
jgi:hypothetical protein